MNNAVRCHGDLAAAHLIGNRLGFGLPSLGRSGVAAQDILLTLQRIDLIELCKGSFHVLNAFASVGNQLVDGAGVYRLRIVGQHRVTQVAGSDVALQAALGNHLLCGNVLV